MPSTPYAKLLASINAGPATHGAITAFNGDTVQFTAESTAQWDLTTPPRWEIFAYPQGWTGPALGWTTESVAQPGGGNADVYVYLGLGPPPSFTLPALPMWGDFLCKLTVQGGALNGVPNSNLVDDRTALRIVGPGGLTDIAVTDSGQFDPARAWVGSWQNDLRILDSALVGAATPYAALPEPVEIGAGSAGAVLNYSKGDHSHPVTVGAPTTIAIGDAAAAGGGTALAGAAHVHALPVPTVISNVSATAGSLGASSVVAREDHAHQVSVGAPGTIQVGDLANQGAASTLARSDHTHALPSPASVTAVSSGAGSVGVSTAVAREDHSHQLSFTTLNTILAAASAPITVNGQTLTSGGFIGPYFSTDAANPSSTGLLRAAKNTTAVAFRNDALSGDLAAVAMTTTNVLQLGASGWASTELAVTAGGFVRFVDGSTEIVRHALAATTYGAGATFTITQDVAVGGAGATAIIRAQAGDAGFNGGLLSLRTGAPGAGGLSSGIELDADDNPTSTGAITMKGGAFGTFASFSYDNSQGETLVAFGPDDTIFDTKILRLDSTNVAVFAATTGGQSGGGTGVMDILNATTDPTTDITDGCGIYASSTSLRARNHALVGLAPQVESAAGSEDLRAPDRRAKRAQTTNATPTTIYTFALPTSCAALFEVEVVAYTPADGTSAAYTITGGAKRFGGGGAALIGAPITIPFEDNAAMDAVLDVSGNNVIVVVTGIAATTIEWFVTPNVTLMKPA